VRGKLEESYPNYFTHLFSAMHDLSTFRNHLDEFAARLVPRADSPGSERFSRARQPSSRSVPKPCKCGVAQRESTEISKLRKLGPDTSERTAEVRENRATGFHARRASERAEMCSAACTWQDYRNVPHESVPIGCATRKRSGWCALGHKHQSSRFSRRRIGTWGRRSAYSTWNGPRKLPGRGSPSTTIWVRNSSAR
jgi:hypothetical protein